MNSHLYTSEEEGVETHLSSLPGTILDGGYEIKELLRSEPHASVFRVRILGDRYTKAEVMFFDLNERDAAGQIECWRNARALRSRNFNAPLSFGTRRLAEAMVPYVVLVTADENLAEVIRERPLKAEEASETMLSVARALVDLHTNGLIHGFVSAEHILSIGQDIKLSGYTALLAGSNPQPHPYRPVYKAPESAGFNSTPAADVWCLGATLIEVLSQKACDDKYTEQLESLPSRFTYIAMRCLEANPVSRATAAEALDMLQGRTPIAIPKAAPPATAAAATAPGTVTLPIIQSAPAPQTIRRVSAASMSTASASTASAPVVSMPAPSTRVGQPVKEGRASEFERDELASKIRPIWIYAGGLLLVLLVLWLAWPRHGDSTGTKQVAATRPNPRPFVQQPKQPLVQQRSVPQTSVVEVAVPKSAGSAEAETASGATIATPTSGEQVWRVIAYAYRRRESAQEMATSINQRHPELAARVFLPSGRVVMYLVEIGSTMTREEATRYLSRAIKSGMPRDSYIQNYRSE